MLLEVVLMEGKLHLNLFYKQERRTSTIQSISDSLTDWSGSFVALVLVRNRAKLTIRRN